MRVLLAVLFTLMAWAAFSQTPPTCKPYYQLGETVPLQCRDQRPAWQTWGPGQVAQPARPAPDEGVMTGLPKEWQQELRH